MIILNMGIPRSGTVWTFNVCRRILEAGGVSYSTKNANSPPDVDAALSAVGAGENLILHFHEVTDKVQHMARQAGVASVFNFRDPRDVVVSQMRLHEVEFDQAVNMTVAAYRTFQTALAIPGLMMVPYPHIEEHAEALIFQIALRLGQVLDLQTVRSIAEHSTARRHKEIMDDLNRASKSDSEGKDPALFTGRRSIRYDGASLISDRHIQSGKSGRWRNELSPEEQATVNRVFARPIRLLGFDLPADQPHARAAVSP